MDNISIRQYIYISVERELFIEWFWMYTDLCCALYEKTRIKKMIELFNRLVRSFILVFWY